jgi:hypothetical protein
MLLALHGKAAREEHVEPLWGSHENNMSVLVASGQARDDNFTLLTLIDSI